MTIADDAQRLKDLRKEINKDGRTHASQCSDADRAAMQRILDVHIARGTATPKMLRAAKAHGLKC